MLLCFKGSKILKMSNPCAVLYLIWCSGQKRLLVNLSLCYFTKSWIQSFNQLVFFQTVQDLYFFLEWADHMPHWSELMHLSLGVKKALFVDNFGSEGVSAQINEAYDQSVPKMSGILVVRRLDFKSVIWHVTPSLKKHLAKFLRSSRHRDLASCILNLWHSLFFPWKCAPMVFLRP